MAKASDSRTGAAVYDESKVKTLSSIEHIRLRTGMYIGRLGDGSHPDDGIYVLFKEVMDNAVPSGNSLAAVGLLRLAALTGDDARRERAEAIVRLLGSPAARVPTAFGHLLLAAELVALGTTEVVVSGDRPDLVAELRRHWLPLGVTAWGERTSSPLWEGRDETGADGRGYVCRGWVCQVPATNPAELAAQLTST